MLKRIISAVLILSILTITAVPVSAEAEVITTRPGGYYYDEYVYEDMEDYPRFLFGAGDWLYAVTYNRPSSDEVYRYVIYAFDREANLKTKYILPYDKNQRYHEFSCDINGLITLVVFIPYEDSLPGVKRLVGDRITYNLVDGKLVAKKTEENFVFHENYNNGNEYEVVKQVDTFYEAGETDIKSVNVSGGSLFGTFRDGHTEMLANKEAIEEDLTKDSQYADQFVDLQRGDFAITDGYNYIKIFRKTDKPHADLKEFYVGYTSDSEYVYQSYVNAYNAAHDDFVAVPRYVYKRLDNMPSAVDLLLINKSDPFYTESLANGHLADLYEFMGTDYFDKEKILLGLLSANETDGKLYSFSPLWEFDIMTANADIVTAEDFSSFDAMTSLEKESGEVRLFSDKTRASVFDTIAAEYINVNYDAETGAAKINPSELEKIKEFALLYPTEDEYRASEDYDKMGFANYFGYYEGGDSPAYYLTQFDIGDYRSGRYAASVFTGPTIPLDSDYEDEYYGNIFRNFSSYVNILYKGNFVLPGFWGEGTVKGTPANSHTAAVSVNVKSTDGAKSFINFLLTEYEPGYFYSLSADVLERQAEEAAGLSRTHERGGKLVRDTIYFSSNDYFEMPDVTEDEVTTLLNAIKYESFPAEPVAYNYYYYYYSIFYGDNAAKYLNGEITAAEYAKLLEEDLAESQSGY